MTKFHEMIRKSDASLAQVAGNDASLFESVSEWLDYAGELEAEDACIRLGLTEDRGGDIYEINYQQARRIMGYR